MSEESLTSQDKEELKRRLELLQKEYERTAQRLQRAERREAVRKHVQNTISEQNRLLHLNTSATLEPGSSSPEQVSSRSVPPDSTKVRFHLPDASPFSSMTCKRSPSRSHRLRSKSSRLRLQIRERESDTEESQEKTREGTEERWREERGETESGHEGTREEKEKDVARGHTDEERKQEEESREKTKMLMDELSQNEKTLTPENHHSAAESASVHQSPLPELLKVHDPPADLSALRNSPSASSDHSLPSDETSIQSCSVNAEEKRPGCSYFLNSCTLIEGLPFPVEYYVRTTRRMASAHSSLDLNAVIHSQLSNGRGRRRASRGRITSQPSTEKPPERNESRKRGRRRRRRARQSDSSGQSDSLCHSPTALTQEEPEPISSPSLDSAPESQLHLTRELAADSQVYPIFQKRHRKTGGKGTPPSQVRASINDSSHLLPSLTSLAQTLRNNLFPNLGSSLTMFDVQDFHLPDDEFGQLKLQRLRSSCLAVESLAYSAGCRKSGSASVSEDGQVEKKKVPLDPLPHGASIERTLALTVTEQLQVESADQSECRITSERLDRTQEPVGLLQSCIANRTKIQQNNDTEHPHTLFASRSVMLNLSLSLTSHTQIDHSLSLVSLGATPNPLTVPPSPQLTPFLSLPPNQEVALEQSHNDNEETAIFSTSPEVQNPGREASEQAYSRSSGAAELASDFLRKGEIQHSDEGRVTEVKIGCQKNAEIPKLTNKLLICSETESQCRLPPNDSPLPPNDSPLPPNDPRLCPNDPRLPPNDPRLPPNDSSLPPNDSPLPPNDSPLPPNESPLPPNDPHLPPNDSPLPPNDPRLPPNDPRLPPNDPRLPPNDPRLPPNDSPLPRNDSPLPRNDSPLPPNDSPLPPNDSPLPPNDSPFFPNDSPLPPNDSPLPPNDPRLPPNDPRLPPNDSPLPRNDSPLPRNDSPLPPNDSPLPPNDSPFFPNDSPLPLNDSPLPPNDSPLPPNDSPLPPNDPRLPPNDPRLPPNDPRLPPNDPRLPPNDPRLPPNDSPLPPNDPRLPPNDSPLPPNHLLLPPNGCVNQPEWKLKISDADELDFLSTSRTSPPGDNMLNTEASVLPVVSANQREDSPVTSSLNLVKSSETKARDSPSQQVALPCGGSLRKTHSLKALDGGCVLDVCLVRWPSDDWCVCVAGEWSVCVWKQNAGVQQWRLLYTWTFTQSVISLQGVPDSSALLCVCLGRLEISEARILCCPSTHGEFSQSELYKGRLQAVLAVSDGRVTCCSSSGTQQNLQVFTLSQDGRVADTLSLVPTHEPVQTLVLVEREKDALIGWTEHKSLLIWNMKSGQLLQTIRLMETVSTATCLRGYSYRGVLCVLLQQVSVCHEESSSMLFTLIAVNPLTGQYFTLRRVATPSAPSERLIDGDVWESALVAVFHSGLTIWNLTEGVACVYPNEPAEVCRLARWAGPNTLLTGYLNGDVHIHQFHPFTEGRTEFKGF